MTQSVTKETFVDADEKTTKALTYDLITGICNKIDKMHDCQVAQVQKCSTRMGKMEKKRASDRRKDTAVSASSGFFGGATIWLGIYLKQLISK